MVFSYKKLLDSAHKWGESPVFMEYLQYLQEQGELLGMQVGATFDFFINKQRISPLVFVPGRYATEENRALGTKHKFEVEKFKHTPEWAAHVITLTALRKIGCSVVCNEALMNGVLKKFPYSEYLKVSRVYFEKHLNLLADIKVTTDAEREALKQVRKTFPAAPARDLFSYIPKTPAEPKAKQTPVFAEPKPAKQPRVNPKIFIPPEVLNMGPRFTAQYVKAMKY